MTNENENDNDNDNENENQNDQLVFLIYLQNFCCSFWKL